MVIAHLLSVTIFQVRVVFLQLPTFNDELNRFSFLPSSVTTSCASKVMDIRVGDTTESSPPGVLDRCQGQRSNGMSMGGVLDVFMDLYITPKL